jgi:hypothetical protein
VFEQLGGYVRSPKSGMITTMSFPAFSVRAANRSAAHTLAPAEIQPRMPSSVPSALATVIASS